MPSNNDFARSQFLLKSLAPVRELKCQECLCARISGFPLQALRKEMRLLKHEGAIEQIEGL